MSFRFDKSFEVVEETIPTCDRCGNDLPELSQARRTTEWKYAGVVLSFVASAWPNEKNASFDRTGTRIDRLQTKSEGRDGRSVDLCPPCADAVYDRLTADLKPPEETATEWPGYPQRFLLSCGCKAELSDSLRWRILSRCPDHPTGAVPITSMTLLNEKTTPSIPCEETT